MRQVWFLGLVALSFGFPSYSEEEDPLIEEKPLSVLIKQLRAENRGLQLRAAQALSVAKADLHPRIATRVIPVLKSERENDKFVAAQTLGNYGAVARVAVPDLLPMLKGTQFERNRAAAAKALGQILKDCPPGEDVEQVTQCLMAVFEDRYEDVRREAVTACGMIGPAAKSCIPSLTPRLKEPPTSEPNMVSMAAAWTCERMGPLAKEHVDLLISILHLGPSRKTPAYVRALGEIGPVQENIVPNLVTYMENGPAWYMVETWQTLQKYGVKAEEVIPFAKRVLTRPQFYGLNGSNEKELCMVEAMKFLVVAGPKAVAVLPEVEQLVNYKHEFDARPLMKKEAAKTLVILQGVAAGNGGKAAAEKEKK